MHWTNFFFPFCKKKKKFFFFIYAEKKLILPKYHSANNNPPKNSHKGKAIQYNKQDVNSIPLLQFF